MTGYYRFDHVVAERGRGRGADGRAATSPSSSPSRPTSPRRVDARRPSADPDRGRRHRPGGRQRRDLDARQDRAAARCCANGARRPRRRSRRRRSSRSSSTGATIPRASSQYNIVPGLLGVILQMTMVMMTSMALTREIERGTMENLLAMPATPGRDHDRQDPALSRRRRGAGRGGAGRRRSCCSTCPSTGSLSLLLVGDPRLRRWRWCCSATPSRPSRARRCRRCS